MKNKWFALVIFGCISGLFFALQLQYNLCDPAFQMFDSQSYFEAAEHLYIQHTPHIFRPLGYPLLLGLPYLCGLSPNVYWAVGLNVVFWVGTLYFLYQIVLKITENTRISMYLTALLGLNLGSFALVFQVLSETIFTFCLVIFAYFFQKYWIENRSKSLIIASFILVFAALVRPVALYIWVFFILVSIVLIWKKNIDTLSKKKIVLASIISFGLF